MATVTQGNSTSFVIYPGGTVTFANGPNVEGRIALAAVVADDGRYVTQGASKYGPPPFSGTIGPFPVRVTCTIYADIGTTTYTHNTANSYNPTAVAITGGAVDSTPVGGTTPASGAFTTLSASGAVTLNPANAAASMAPSGTGNATFGPTGTGTGTLQRINAMTVISTDSSGTPGNATNNNLSGRAAFAAAASTCVITNSQVTAASKVFVSLGSADATLTSVRVTPGAGSFTVTGNAAATGTTVFDFLVVN